jgi:hypothetical protein
MTIHLPGIVYPPIIHIHPEGIIVVFLKDIAWHIHDTVAGKVGKGQVGVPPCPVFTILPPPAALGENNIAVRLSIKVATSIIL